jgi:hypothetical protein
MKQTDTIKKNIFYSPSDDVKYDFESILKRFESFINTYDKYEKYHLIFATDSLFRKNNTVFSSAIILHRIGKGAIYFYNKYVVKNNMSVKARIFQETTESILIAQEFLDILGNSPIMERIDGFLVDIDAGENGLSREAMTECLSYVHSCGFKGRVKPESTARMCADKHTR